VVVHLLKIVLDEQVTLLLCICKVHSLRLSLMDIVMIFLQIDGQDSTSVGQ